MNPEFVISLVYTGILLVIVVLWTMDIRKLSRRTKTLERTISENHVKN